MSIRRRMLAAGALLVTALMPSSAVAAPPRGDPVVEVVVSGLAGGSGSAIGPDGALYVTEAEVGRLSRVDLRTGDVTTVATGLPKRIAPTGGAMDVAFLGRTPYVLVTMVGAQFGGDDVGGVYRVDGPDSVTLVADLDAFSLAHPPETDFFIPTGVQYALEPYRGGFLVTDGHHNRVLQVAPDGSVSEVVALGNVVPTGLDVRGATVYLALAGPVPHRPQDGRVVAFRAHRPQEREVARGGPLLVDVELGRGHVAYGLAQGIWPGGPDGAPASPDTGRLLRATRDGGFEVLVDRLDRPTSFELVGRTAYVVTLDGEVWRIENLPRGGHGIRHD